MLRTGRLSQLNRTPLWLLPCSHCDCQKCRHFIKFHGSLLIFQSIFWIIGSSATNGSSRLSPQSSPYPWAHALHRHLAASADRRCTHPSAAAPHLTAVASHVGSSLHRYTYINHYINHYVTMLTTDYVILRTTIQAISAIQVICHHPRLQYETPPRFHHVFTSEFGHHTSLPVMGTSTGLGHDRCANRKSQGLCL